MRSMTVGFTAPPSVQVPASAVLIDTVPKSRHSSCSDLDDDVFLDALRYPLAPHSVTCHCVVATVRQSLIW